MKREVYMYGVRGEQYGIWNTVKKCWQFGICEDTPMLAEARLFQKIGDDARKYRFEARCLPPEMRQTIPEPAIMTELARKDREISPFPVTVKTTALFVSPLNRGFMETAIRSTTFAPTAAQRWTRRKVNEQG